MQVDLFAGLPVRDYEESLEWYRRLLGSDLDAMVAEIAARGIQPTQRETHSNGVRKATYRDPDGNEVGLGSAPLTPR